MDVQISSVELLCEKLAGHMSAEEEKGNKYEG
jgi:hypothetical protein